MTASPSWELQKDIVTMLKADTTLQNLGIGQRWFDYVPKHSQYPFGRYGEEATAEFDTSETGAKSGDGKEHTISIHVFDDYEGTKRIREILARVDDLLQNNTSFSLTDHTLVNMRFLFMDVVPDPDGQTYHGIAQYRAVTEEN